VVYTDRCKISGEKRFSSTIFSYLSVRYVLFLVYRIRENLKIFLSRVKHEPGCLRHESICAYSASDKRQKSDILKELILPCYKVIAVRELSAIH
jgi:hypothetical protein